MPTGYSISEVNQIALDDLDTIGIAGDGMGETFIADFQAANINWQQDLHLMPDRTALMPSHPFVLPFSNQGSPQHFNELWSKLLIKSFEGEEMKDSGFADNSKSGSRL